MPSQARSKKHEQDGGGRSPTRGVAEAPARDLSRSRFVREPDPFCGWDDATGLLDDLGRNREHP
jgi:hypothetical protein